MARLARHCAVSIDLDEIHHYRRLHGRLGRPAESTVYRVALGRALAFAEREALSLSLFAVGEDLAVPRQADALLEASRRGHAVENHSHTHPYAFAGLAGPALAEEVDAAQRAIEHVTGRRPVAFRAPGYAASDGLLDALEASGIPIDSSAFPCPAYYAAKALAIAGLALRGRRSAAVIHPPSSLAAPTVPYRPGRRWYRRGSRPLCELPVQVTPVLRLPFIGTSLSLGGPRIARALARMVAPLRCVQLELHGLDFLDASDGLADLAPAQPDLRVPLAAKLRSLSAALAVLREAGHRFVRLDVLASELGLL